jgi:KaiC/GvpD/RAD55 family RecA-like ATPase
MKKVVHNLPDPPYSKFFGRQNSINSIIENLLEGNTYIVSIDGVGGIGKTALAYHFCKDYLIEKEKFDYIIWLTAKETVFDAFSEERQIKEVKNEFKGITTLIDTTLETLKCQELLDADFESRKTFFEDVITNNSIFFVFDNLENVHDNAFFEYITKDFNKIANKNRRLKVLTTSRTRKKARGSYEYQTYRESW